MNAAAIDLGTNSIKLLIVRRDKEGHMQVLFRHRSVVRLGEGSYAKKGPGKIPRYVQLRTLKVFQTYAQFLEAYKVDVVRATGTSALRDASNGPQFVKEVRAKTGIALEILPGAEEARLIVKGVASEMTLPRKSCVFVDIGGGSCEISMVRGRKIEKFASLPLGAVRLSELYVQKAKPDSANLRKMDAHIRKVLKDYWPQPQKMRLAYGSAGTIRALARLISKTELSDDERQIKRVQLERIADNVSKMSQKRIAALPGIDPKRAEILVAGTHVLREVFNYFSIDSLRVSNRGLREGLLLDLFDHPQKPSGTNLDPKMEERLEFLSSLGHKYHSNRAHTYQVWNLARLLFDELAPVHGLPVHLKMPLMVACILHDVGRYVSANSSHKHTYYILNNTDFPFLNEKDRRFVATLARYHRKSPPRSGHQGFDEMSQEEKKNLNALAAIIRLADALDAPHDQGVKWLKCQWGPGKVHIHAELKPGSGLNQEVIKDKGKLFEDLFKVNLTVGLLADMRPQKTAPQDTFTRSKMVN